MIRHLCSFAAAALLLATLVASPALAQKQGGILRGGDDIGANSCFHDSKAPPRRSRDGDVPPMSPASGSVEVCPERQARIGIP